MIAGSAAWQSAISTFLLTIHPRVTHAELMTDAPSIADGVIVRKIAGNAAVTKGQESRLFNSLSLEKATTCFHSMRQKLMKARLRVERFFFDYPRREVWPRCNQIGG
jgi:hypothetical protein